MLSSIYLGKQKRTKRELEKILMTKKHYEIVASSIQNQINKVVENDELDFDGKYLQLKFCMIFRLQWLMIGIG